MEFKLLPGLYDISKAVTLAKKYADSEEQQEKLRCSLREMGSRGIKNYNNIKLWKKIHSISNKLRKTDSFISTSKAFLHDYQRFTVALELAKKHHFDDCSTALLYYRYAQARNTSFIRRYSEAVKKDMFIALSYSLSLYLKLAEEDPNTYLPKVYRVKWLRAFKYIGNDAHKNEQREIYDAVKILNRWMEENRKVRLSYYAFALYELAINQFNEECNESFEILEQLLPICKEISSPNNLYIKRFYADCLTLIISINKDERNEHKYHYNEFTSIAIQLYRETIANGISVDIDNYYVAVNYYMNDCLEKNKIREAEQALSEILLYVKKMNWLNRSSWRYDLLLQTFHSIYQDLIDLYESEDDLSNAEFTYFEILQDCFTGKHTDIVDSFTWINIYYKGLVNLYLSHGQYEDAIPACDTMIQIMHMRTEISEDNYESFASSYVDDVDVKAQLLCKLSHFNEAKKIYEDLINYIGNHHNIFHEDQKAAKLLDDFLSTYEI